MKIYIVSHGNWDFHHISLCTTDFELAIKHFLDYSKTAWYNSMSRIDVWENNKEIFNYGDSKYDIIYTYENKELTYDDIKNDFMKNFNEVIKK